jgi:putative phosphoesterase
LKIGVISDTHGSVTAWQKASLYLETVDLIIHCGDVLYHGPRNPLPEGYAPTELAQAINRTAQPLIFAQGNCDAEVDQLLVNFPIQTPYAQVFTPRWQILVHHGHHLNSMELPTWTHSYNLVISGHTHLPGISQQGHQFLLNPGSPALPKNVAQTPSIALLDDSGILLINLVTGEPLSSAVI